MPASSLAPAPRPLDDAGLAALIRAHDWAATPLGPLAGWPAALHCAVDLVVHAPLPMTIAWGPALTQIYNDAYAALCGPRHPAALGRSKRDNWPELEAFMAPVLAQVFEGQARCFRQRRAVVEHNGAPREAWLDLTLSPIHDGGRVGGVLVIVVDATERVRSEQALRLNDLRFQTFADAGIAYRMNADWTEMRRLDGHGVLADTRLPRRDWLDAYIPEDDRPMVRAALARAVAARDAFELEHRVRLADGTLGWLLSRAVPLQGEHGEIGEWFGTASDITGRRRAAEDERRAGQRIDRALDAGAVAGTWYWDVVRDRFTADERFARSFALDPLALRDGMRLAEVTQSIHPDDQAMVAQRIADALARGGAYRAEYRVREQEGGYRWVEANGYVTLDARGRALTFPGVLVDVGERRARADRQDALLRLADLLRPVDSVDAAAAVAADIIGATLGATVAGFGRVDPVAATVTIPNNWRGGPGAPDVAGVHRLEHYGSYLADLRRGEVVAIADVALDPRTAPRLASFQAFGLFSLLNVPVLDSRGLIGVVLVHQDRPRAWSADEIAFVEGVADRAWAEMARIDAVRDLQALNQDLERQVAATTADRNRLWQLSSDVMLVAGRDGRLSAVNPAWTAILGWTKDELLGASVLDLIHPDDVAATLQAARDVDAAGRIAPGFTNRYRHRDGSYRWFAWNTTRSDGMLVAVGRDVTRERERASTLHDTEERLRQSLKMEAVGQLTGGLAHDFNNLLASIGGSLELLALRVKRGDLEDLERFTGIAQGAVRRAAALTHRLLAFSRRQPLDARATDAGRLVDGMLDLVRRTIGPAIALEMSAMPGLWTVLADPNQLENALLNLCINARDAMPDGGRLCIALANVALAAGTAADYELGAGDYVRLSVSDTGTGMPPEVAAKAFDPFFTTKPTGQGTGLGLSMIYGFVRQSGGGVRLESRPGHGTAMHVLLPRHDGPLAAPAPAAVPMRTVAAGTTVLVVDDEAPLRGLMAEALGAVGHRVLAAPDAAAALRLLDGGTAVDLLVTDIGLTGGMNGRQLAEAARAAHPGLKVLFITGYAEGRLVEHGSLDGGTGLLTKPFALAALAQRVADMVRGG